MRLFWLYKALVTHSPENNAPQRLGVALERSVIFAFFSG